jgi:hypothetical protein
MKAQNQFHYTDEDTETEEKLLAQGHTVGRDRI